MSDTRSFAARSTPRVSVTASRPVVATAPRGRSNASQRPRRSSQVPVDPIYKSVLVTQLTNKILERGKRTIAERIVYTALEQVEQKTGTDPVATLKRALENVRPELEVRSRRVGGTTYQVPVEVRPRRATTLAIPLADRLRQVRHGKTITKRLANE